MPQPRTINYEIKKVYYSISEACELLGITTSALRFWESQHPELAPKIRRGSMRTRYYSIKEFENLKRFHYLIYTLGFTVKGAYAQLQNKDY